jgi:hypothetical protein
VRVPIHRKRLEGFSIELTLPDFGKAKKDWEAA